MASYVSASSFADPLIGTPPCKFFSALVGGTRHEWLWAWLCLVEV